MAAGMINKLKLVMRKTADLVPYARNARTHGAEQIEQIAASMKAYGFNAPVLVDGDGGIIAGHGRVMAAQLLELDAVPTISLAHLNDEQKRKYIIADNRIAENSEWDTDLLKDELLELFDGSDFEAIESIGFDEQEFRDAVGLVERVGMPTLNTGGKNVLEQITFTVHKDQMLVIKQALNENKNGNALHALCLQYNEAAQ